MKAKRFKTRVRYREVELDYRDCDSAILIGIVDKFSERVTVLTPAQARRIAAHLVKLAEMREGKNKR